MTSCKQAGNDFNPCHVARKAGPSCRHSHFFFKVSSELFAVARKFAPRWSWSCWASQRSCRCPLTPPVWTVSSSLASGPALAWRSETRWVRVLVTSFLWFAHLFVSGPCCGFNFTTLMSGSSETQAYTSSFFCSESCFFTTGQSCVWMF